MHLLAQEPRLKAGLLAAFLALTFGWSVPGGAAPAAVDVPLLVTQVPRAAKAPDQWQPAGLVRADWFEAARIVVVNPDGATRVLSEGFAAACDPNVSFDGKRVVFAARREAGSSWRIYEAGVDGKGVRPISPENQDARHPIHACTLFTLDSPEPWFTIVYSAREGGADAANGAPSSLFNIKLDGTELRRLTFNPTHSLDPFQMWDSRVIYAAEHRPLAAGAGAPRLGLYAIHVEGADMEFYGGGGGRRIQQMPCGTEGGLVVFVESDTARWDGAGQLACVEESRPHVSYRRLTGDLDWLYLHPSPYRAKTILAARRAANGESTWSLCAFDAGTGRCDPVFDSPEYHDVQAVPVRARPRPDGHSTVVDPKLASGIFYGLNCYDAAPAMAPHLRAGTVARVRFIEGVSSHGAKESLGTAPQPTRLVGEAPVETDGSFNVEVPADTPLLLQTLDERGMALANCGWIWVKPREKRGCIGCHEDPERIPENEYVLALRRPSNRLLLPPAERRTVTFKRDIAPILQDHCAAAECHGGNDTPLHLSPAAGQPADHDPRRAYAALTMADAAPGGDQARPAGRYVDPFRARTSWLVWQLSGANTSRPWDAGGGSSPTRDRKVRQMPPPDKGGPLKPEELRTIIQWIDMGAPYEVLLPPEPEEKRLVESK
jgi:hypothetical protein